MKKFFTLLIFVLVGGIALAGDFKSYNLDNGQTVIIKEIKENPIVIIDTWIKTGSINENDKNNGVAHFLEHMFFKGTHKYSAGEFDKILESKGAIINAATSKDFTHYYIMIPSKDFDTALEMHADMLLNPLIPRKELEKERKVVLEEISKNEDSPQRILYSNLSSLLYKNHPYKRDVIGTRQVIETITREEMLNFYNKFYTPSNMTTIVVGDVDSQVVLEKINNLFGNVYSKNSLPKYKKEKPLTEEVEKVEKADVETAYMLIGFRGVDAKNKKENYELDVLATILGEGVTSRLYKNVKDQKRLVQSISAYNSSSRDDGIFAISSNFAPENLDKVKRAIIEEIQLIQKAPPTQEELNKAFSILERDTYYSRESVSNISSEMGYIKTIFDDIEMYDNYISDIKNVTAQQVQAVAKKFLDTNKMAVSIVLPKTYVVQNEIESGTEPKEIIQPKLVGQNATIQKYLLANGATLLVGQNTSNDVIAVKIYSKGGKLSEKKAGIASIVADGMMKGTKKYTKNEFSQIKAEKGIKLSAAADLESFDVSLKTTKNELDSALELLDEAINNALFDSYEIDKIKSDKLYEIKSSRDNPFYVALEEFKELIYQNSPYSKSTTKKAEKSIPSINRNDVLYYYDNLFNPQNIIISVNGNLDDVQKDRIFKFFSTVFKSKNSQQFDFANYKNSVPALTSVQQKTVKKDTQAAWLTLGWQTCGLDNEKDYVTLQVINSIMGRGMSSRLFVNLRDQQGLAYQIGSSYSANMNKGFFLTYIGTNPQQALHAKNEILREVNLLKREFVTQKELQAAKDKLIGNFILSQETNSEKASLVGWFETTNRGYAFNEKYPELIQSVTPNDIISVANKYFSQPYVFTMVDAQTSKN